MEIKKASKKQLKLKVALSGTSGSGKTTSALLIAYGLVGDWSKILVIDTENRSSELYVGMKVGDIVIGEFQTIQLSAPYSPERYIEAINLGYSESEIHCIVIDSMSHEWEGSGGILSIADQMTGNSFTNWAKITPRHNKFIETIVNLNKHVISTFRAKQDYVLQDKNGKIAPEKVGLKSITREGVDYEFTLCFDIDIKHNATTSKDRTGLFMDKPIFVPNIETGSILKSWCESGDIVKTSEELMKECNTIEELSKVYTSLTAEEKVRVCAEKDKLKNELTKKIS